ncbi:MauE/DoxX family redox-associated membrane protein [Methylophaga sp. OBS3]|uniref:MauE/DoxX family redox-associated membrane protein n=1 Tax=Methylophaga sp. OBS3 TaxID=2991934 RepID=UPI00224DAF9E|nr:MauE/DoxX family redox-associated membrane protein [Methylophaga sp. OBS3]MCX4190508.1 methylamine utilization protein MauE [Methylophaga sp. OBS3]
MSWLINDPALSVLATLFVGLVLLVAAVSKLRSLDEFQGVVENYRLLPEFLVAPVARTLPVVELVCAAALMIPQLREMAAWVAVGLFVVFAMALAINVGRGRTHIDCGCVRRPTSKSRIGMFHVLRALLLAGVSIYIALSSLEISTISLASWLIGIASAALLAMLYIAADVMVGLPNSRESRT